MTYPRPTYALDHIETTNKKPLNAPIIMTALILGTGSVYAFDDASHWVKHIRSRVPFAIEAGDNTTTTSLRPDVRTSIEHLENIRQVLDLSMSELSVAFSVSRQAIYKWLEGSSPEEATLNRIIILSRVADKMNDAQVNRAGALLKMKTFEGRSFLDLVKTGENREEHITALIKEAQIMESAHTQSGLATSRSKSNREWQSTISVPGSTEEM